MITDAREAWGEQKKDPSRHVVFTPSSPSSEDNRVPKSSGLSECQRMNTDSTRCSLFRHPHTAEQPQPVVVGQRPSESRTAVHITRVWLSVTVCFLSILGHCVCPHEVSHTLGPKRESRLSWIVSCAAHGDVASPHGNRAVAKRCRGIPSESKPGSPKASMIPVAHLTYSHPSSAKDRCRSSPMTT